MLYGFFIYDIRGLYGKGLIEVWIVIVYSLELKVFDLKLWIYWVWCVYIFSDNEINWVYVLNFFKFLNYIFCCFLFKYLFDVYKKYEKKYIIWLVEIL